MKRFLTIAMLTISISLGLISCDSEAQHSETTHQSAADSKDKTIPCCQVTCRRGTCICYKYPSSCSCIAGQPVCGHVDPGGDASKAGAENLNVIIEATPAMMELYDEDITFISTTLGIRDAADALQNIKQLFIDNNYSIASEDAIREYHKNLNVYIEFIGTQTEDVVDRLSRHE